MMRTIHLHGRLKKQFGPKHRFDVGTAAEALRALNCAFPGDFVTALQTGSYKLVRGDKRSGMNLDIDLTCKLQLGGADLHIMPAPEGAANSKGVAKTIVGSVLIGSAIFFSGGGLAAPLSAMSTEAFAIGGMSVTWGNIALVGLGLALSGASSLLAKTDSSASDSKSEESYSINGPDNVARQGSAISLIYGEVITGIVTISFDADIEDIGSYQGQSSALSSSTEILTSIGLDGLVKNVVYQNGIAVT
jgi:predicted phage tail protein